MDEKPLNYSLWLYQTKKNTTTKLKIENIIRIKTILLTMRNDKKKCYKYIDLTVLSNAQNREPLWNGDVILKWM